MPQNPTRHVPLDAAVLDLLACPSCQGALSIDDKQLVCAACRRRYPIVDGIPVLIAEPAKTPSLNQA